MSPDKKVNAPHRHSHRFIIRPKAYVIPPRANGMTREGKEYHSGTKKLLFIHDLSTNIRVHKFPNHCRRYHPHTVMVFQRALFMPMQPARPTSQRNFHHMRFFATREKAKGFYRGAKSATVGTPCTHDTCIGPESLLT